MNQEQKHFLIDPESAVFDTSSGAIIAKGRDGFEGILFEHVYSVTPNSLEAARNIVRIKH